MLDMYQNHVLHGGPFDGYQIRARAGTLSIHVVDPDGPARVSADMGELPGIPATAAAGALVAYRRVTIRDEGPFGRNEYHWVDPAAIGDDTD